MFNARKFSDNSKQSLIQWSKSNVPSQIYVYMSSDLGIWDRVFLCILFTVYGLRFMPSSLCLFIFYCRIVLSSFSPLKVKADGHRIVTKGLFTQIPGPLKMNKYMCGFTLRLHKASVFTGYARCGIEYERYNTDFFFENTPQSGFFRICCLGWFLLKPENNLFWISSSHSSQLLPQNCNLSSR